MKTKILLLAVILLVVATGHAQPWLYASNATDIYFTGGKVGIGNITPTEALHVTGNILTNQVFTTSGTYSSSGATNLSFNTNTTNRLTILNANGFVGIGITSPTEALHVNGNILTSGNVSTNQLTSTSVISNSFLSNNGFFNTTASLLALQTNGTNRFVIQSSNGNVGIGTSTPDDKLQISNGNLVIDNSNTPTIYTGSGSTEFNRYLLLSNSVGQPTASGLKAGGVLISDDFGYASPGKSDLVVKGKVAIGTPLTSNPNSYTLAVNGTVGAKDVRVEKSSSTWPDYVFQKDYSLAPLTDVAAYIERNNHLKDVPSASEVEKNGHSLGDMDAILLKKIEELTLYLIQQQKEIEALKKQLNSKP